jgi:glycosyltransferase involved in cell wall biosynthesis
MNKIKILAIMGDNNLSASKYHRLYLPLTALEGKVIKVGEEDKEINVDFIDTFNPPLEILEKYNIIWNNFSCNIPNTIIGLLQSKGIIFIEDVDDYWELPKKSIMVPIVGRSYDNVPILSSLSDVTICATGTLGVSVIPYSNNISISNNDLPIGEGQFTVRDNIKEGEKIVIGVIGSVSHLPDYQSIVNVIKRITLDKEIKEKCKFVIAGYVEKDKNWDKIVAIFSQNGFEVELRNSLPLENYMEAYKGINIVLAPLSDVEFNRKKSALKALECSLWNIPMISNPMYADKEFNGVIVAKTDKSWIETIRYLIQDDNYVEIGKRLGEVNRNLSNFEGRIENLRLLVEASMNKKLVSDLETLDMYSIKYREDQNTEYQSYLNQNKETSWRFEYNPLMNIVPKVEKEYVGVLSWRFLQKTGLAKNLLYNMIKPTLKEGNVDMINLSPRKWLSGKEYMEFSEKQHPGLENLLKLICLKLGVIYNPNPKNIVYSNFFILKTSIYKEYVEEWIKPALACLEGEYWTLANKDANYIGGLSKEDLKLHTGLDYYNMITFVLERLILQFIECKKLKVKNV